MLCRDAWFEVPLPFFLRNSAVGLGWSRANTGAFLGAFIIIYGQMQSWSPQLVLKPLGQSPANKYVAVLWVSLLTACPLIMAVFCLASPSFQDHNVGEMTVVIVVRSFAYAPSVGKCVHHSFSGIQTHLHSKQSHSNFATQHALGDMMLHGVLAGLPVHVFSAFFALLPSGMWT